MATQSLCFGLVGNPNAGKTTLFNALTGARQHVANYPGVTVEKRTGTITVSNRIIEIVDLPGAYTLSAHSLDEQVARDFLLQSSPDVLINVVDASNLSRNLLLTLQLLEFGVPMVVALNMGDLARQRGLAINHKQLAGELGVPVVPVVASRKEGVQELLAAALKAVKEDPPHQFAQVQYGQAIDSHLGELEAIVSRHGDLTAGQAPARWWAIKCLEEDRLIMDRVINDGAGGRQVLEVLRAARKQSTAEGKPTSPARLISQSRFHYAEEICRRVVNRHESGSRRWLDRLDHLAIHPLTGWPIMMMIFGAAYVFTFSTANGEILRWAGITGSPISWIESLFSLMAQGVEAVVPEGILRSLLVNGIINGVGGVLAFVPIIFLMFFVISLIDDSGYMARLAFLLHVPLRMFGLQGKSALAMAVSGGVAGGCAVPGIMATRTLSDPRERIATILVCPFLNCGAKLPVYAMLIAAFFQRAQGMVMLLLTLLSWTFALGGAWLLRKFVVRGEPAPLVLELPPYHRPTLQGALIQAWSRVQLYLRKAGTFILAASILLWVLMSFPRLGAQERAALAHNQGALAQAELAHSFAGRLGKTIQPITRPLGFEWRTNIALIGGVAAKEVVVSTLGTAYSLGDVEADRSASLSQRLAADPHWSPLKAFCLILFVMLYAPCVGTIAAIVQETRSWKWGVFSTIYSTGFAWIVAFVVFQGGRLLGLGG